MKPWRGTEPCIEIRIPVEGDPSVILIAFNSDDEDRMRDWLAARPDLQQLVDWAGEYGSPLKTLDAIIWENICRRDEELEEAA